MAASHQIQVQLETAELEQLERAAERRGVSVGELVRAAVRERYLVTRDERLDVVRRIAAMNLPAGEMAELKQEIEAAYTPGGLD